MRLFKSRFIYDDPDLNIFWHRHRESIVLSNREFSDDNDKLLTYICALANEQAGGFIYFCHAYRGSMIKQGFRNLQNSHVQYVREIVEKNLNRIQNARKNI